MCCSRDLKTTTIKPIDDEKKAQRGMKTATMTMAIATTTTINKKERTRETNALMRVKIHAPLYRTKIPSHVAIVVAHTCDDRDNNEIYDLACSATLWIHWRWGNYRICINYMQHLNSFGCKHERTPMLYVACEYLYRIADSLQLDWFKNRMLRCALCLSYRREWCANDFIAASELTTAFYPLIYWFFYLKI